jgi:hypothetical protein
MKFKHKNLMVIRKQNDFRNYLKVLEIQHYFKLILREDVQNVLSQLTELIKSGQPPESSFSVHISHVRRTAGMLTNDLFFLLKFHTKYCRVFWKMV